MPDPSTTPASPPSPPSPSYEIQDLVLDTLNWLATAERQDVLEYVKRLPAEFWADWLEITQEMLLEMRCRFADAINNNVADGLTAKMSELDRVSFYQDLANFEPISVFANYQRKYPDFPFQKPVPEITEWAKNYAQTWENLMLFMAAHSFLESKVYLESIVKNGKIFTDQERLQREGKGLVKSVAEHISQNNYEDRPIPDNLKVQIKAFLDNFTFLPAETVSGLLEPGNIEWLFSFLQQMTSILTVIKLAIDTGTAPEEIDFDELLWDQMALDMNEQIFLHFDSLKKANSQPETPEEAFVAKLYELLSAERIKDGSAIRALQDYIRPLTVVQRKYFLEQLKVALMSSSDIEELFSVVDVEYFIKTIQNWNKPTSKGDFVDSLESRIIEEYWPYVRKFMLFLVSIYC